MATTNTTIKDITDSASEGRSWEDVLKKLKTRTMECTHVATLAFISTADTGKVEHDKYNEWTCKPTPLLKGQSEYSIKAYSFDKAKEFKDGDIVLIIFMDYDFRTVISSSKPQNLNTTENHSLSYGIIIDFMNGTSSESTDNK